MQFEGFKAFSSPTSLLWLAASRCFNSPWWTNNATTRLPLHLMPFQWSITNPSNCSSLPPKTWNNFPPLPPPQAWKFLQWMCGPLAIHHHSSTIGFSSKRNETLSDLISMNLWIVFLSTSLTPPLEIVSIKQLIFSPLVSCTPILDTHSNAQWTVCL